MEWIKEKLWELNDVFEEFPKVYWCGLFYFVSALMSIVLYVPLFSTIANIDLLGIMPFKQIITENWNVLRWGLVVAPLFIILNGWMHATDLHKRLMRKKYRY